MEPEVIEKLFVNDKINKIHAVSTTPWTWSRPDLRASLHLAELGHI